MLLALKLGVPIILTIVHIESESTAAARHLHRARRLGLLLLGGTLSRRHGRSLGAELSDGPIDRRRGLALAAMLDAEIGDRRLELLGLRRQFFRGRGHLLGGAGVLLADLVELLDRLIDLRGADVLLAAG